MADVWDGPSGTQGVLTFAYNTDKTAIRFSRSDNGPFAAGFAGTIINIAIANLKDCYEALEVIATKLDSVDSAFATNCRNRASAYRTIVGAA